LSTTDVEGDGIEIGLGGRADRGRIAGAGIRRPVAHINDHQQFVLTATATLPAEDGEGSPGTPPPPGGSANLLVKTIWPSHQPGHSVSIVDIVLTALQVDEIVVA
jgi:hypothetical protein